jgi:hypothetical protein
VISRRRLTTTLTACALVAVLTVATLAWGAGRMSSALSSTTARPVSARSTNAEVVAAAVREIEHLDGSAARAAYLAQAAAACRSWDAPRASELVRQAIAELGKEPRRPADGKGEAWQADLAVGLHRELRLDAIRALIRVDPRLALAAAERADLAPDDLASMRVLAALTARGTDAAWSRQQLGLVPDPAVRAFAALRIVQVGITSHGAYPAVGWAEVAPALPRVRQEEGPELRATLLVVLGALARRNGAARVWDRELRPEVRQTLASLPTLLRRAMGYSSCLAMARALDPGLQPDLLAAANRDLQQSTESAERKLVARVYVMRNVDPLEALRLARQQKAPAGEAASLIGIVLSLPPTARETAAVGADTGLALLRRWKATSGACSGLLYAIARSRPDAALEAARREGKRLGEEQRLYDRVLTGAARTQPNWALAHVRLLTDRESRVRIMLTAVEARVHRAH